MGGRRAAVALAALGAATAPLLAPAALATTLEPPCEDVDVQVAVVETQPRVNGIWARLDVANVGSCPTDDLVIGFRQGFGGGFMYATYDDGPAPWPAPWQVDGTEARAVHFGGLPATTNRRIDVGLDWPVAVPATAWIVAVDADPHDPTPDDAVVHLDVSAAPPTSSFPDVAATNPFTAPIAWVAHHDVTGGYADGGYHPTAPVSRQAIVAMLWRLAGRPQVPFTAAEAPFPFVDVGHDHPFATAIDWAQGRGLVAGYADGGFHPTATVSRQALVAVLWRLAGSPIGAPDPGYPDVPAGHPFADAIAWATDTGLATGYADGGFHPAAAVSRQAAAAWLTRWADAP